jgi:uncharacterized protein (TIGR02300 family)
MKAMRGTKRVCQACGTRFYDLSRDPIVCPSCGAHHVPEAPAPVAETGLRAAGFTGKTSWRGRRINRPADPGAEPHADPEPDVPPEVAAAEEAPEEAPAPSEDVVLDEEPDEAEISDLLDYPESDPKEP